MPSGTCFPNYRLIAMTSHLHGLLVFGLASLAGLAFPSAAADANDDARALIGIEYVDVPANAPIPGSECASVGNGTIHIHGERQVDWSLGQVGCGTRTAFVLQRLLGSEGRTRKWRVVDAMLLPPMKEATQVLRQGDCELDGEIDTDVFALVRFGKRDKVNHRTGVLAAWTVDLEAQKIVPVSTRRIVCYRPTPP